MATELPSKHILPQLSVTRLPLECTTLEYNHWPLVRLNLSLVSLLLFKLVLPNLLLLDSVRLLTQMKHTSS